MTDDELHQLLGAYLLGGLDSADRERFARHLAACEACRDELARSAALPSLLRRAEGLWEPGVPTAPPAAPPELLDRVRAGRAGVRRRRRWAVVGVVAASLTLGLLAGLLTAGAVADRRAEVATAARTTPLESTGGSLSSGRVSLSSRPWGTSIGLVVRDLPTDRRFELRVVAADGSTQTACSWSATDLPEVSVVGATGTAVGAIDRLEVVDAADGEVYAVAHG